MQTPLPSPGSDGTVEHCCKYPEGLPVFVSPLGRVTPVPWTPPGKVNMIPSLLKLLLRFCIIYNVLLWVGNIYERVSSVKVDRVKHDWPLVPALRSVLLQVVISLVPPPICILKWVWFWKRFCITLVLRGWLEFSITLLLELSIRGCICCPLVDKEWSFFLCSSLLSSKFENLWGCSCMCSREIGWSNSD